MQRTFLIILTLILLTYPGAALSGDIFRGIDTTKLSLSQQLDLEALLISVTHEKGQPADTKRNDFWRIASELEEPQLQKLIDNVQKIYIDHRLLLYADTLRTLRFGGITRSTQRENLEKELLQRGLVSSRQIDHYDDLLLQLLNKESTPRLSGVGILNENNLKLAISALEDGGQRLNHLLHTPPDTKKRTAVNTYRTSDFALQVQGANGTVDITASFTFHFTRGDTSTTKAEIREKEQHIIDTIRHILFTAEVSTLEKEHAWSRLQQKLLRHINVIIHNGHIDQVDIDKWLYAQEEALLR
ncbi:hypothetical protein [Desulfurispira natronophila]|uniref:Flagellar basal body-associated protein FliL n=1 Tax=Desulfurispira natronophila TaxID=682562 RepID=A0A7W7Y2D6_9BACT|nr:hypothetical protein [Desulfurispira natronophila]MBB5020764.1 flagellar basal body-associated protein FliL [Desulfurispira natronophila]